MNRYGIVHSTPDFLFLQTPPDFIALPNSNRVDGINVPRIIRLERRSNAFDSLETLIVLQSMFAPQEISSFKMAQFDGQDCRLNAVHPAIPTDQGMTIFSGLTMISQSADFLL